MRSVIVGDVHGCADELTELLDKLQYTDSDDLFFVGDLIVRGPYSHRVVKMARELGARSVRGNHEDRLLQRIGEPVLDLDAEDWAYIEAMPLWIDHGNLRIVHAGVVPGVPIEAHTMRQLLYLRTIGPDGHPSELRDGGALWGTHYVGPPHIVFGHNALDEPQQHAWATGIDTGCVYGRKLTALVVEDDAHRLVQVSAHKTYVSC